MPGIRIIYFPFHLFVVTFRPTVIGAVSLLIMGMGLFSEAEAKTIEAGHAAVSWKGKGVVEDLVGQNYSLICQDVVS